MQINILSLYMKYKKLHEHNTNNRVIINRKGVNYVRRDKLRKNTPGNNENTSIIVSSLLLSTLRQFYANYFRKLS